MHATLSTTPNGSTDATASAARTRNLIQALIALSLKVARRTGDDTDIEAKIELYAADLATWPERTALAVLAEHPRRSIYWPAWKELEDLRGEIEASKREREHRALPPSRSWPRRPEPSYDALFVTKAEWLGFEQALANLRDPSIPCIAREALLKIGESIEARQKPHAERMGWTR